VRKKIKNERNKILDVSRYVHSNTDREGTFLHIRMNRRTEEMSVSGSINSDPTCLFCALSDALGFVMSFKDLSRKRCPQTRLIKDEYKSQDPVKLFKLQRGGGGEKSAFTCLCKSSIGSRFCLCVTPDVCRILRSRNIFSRGQSRSALVESPSKPPF
jgi:hypothetical protein